MERLRVFLEMNHWVMFIVNAGDIASFKKNKSDCKHIVMVTFLLFSDLMPMETSSINKRLNGFVFTYI